MDKEPLITKLARWSAPSRFSDCERDKRKEWGLYKKKNLLYYMYNKKNGVSWGGRKNQ